MMSLDYPDEDQIVFRGNWDTDLFFVIHKDTAQELAEELFEAEVISGEEASRIINVEGQIDIERTSNIHKELKRQLKAWVKNTDPELIDPDSIQFYTDLVSFMSECGGFSIYAQKDVVRTLEDEKNRD